MNLQDFNDINVLKLPIFCIYDKEDQTRKRLPEQFFLHNENHVIFVKIFKKPHNKTAYLYDSLGWTSPNFIEFLNACHDIFSFNQVFRGKPFQKAYDSNTCGIYAILFSIGYVPARNCTDFSLLKYIKPVLELYTIQYTSKSAGDRIKNRTLPLPSCFTSVKPLLKRLQHPR